MSRHWTENEIEVLKTLYLEESFTDLALRLGRTPLAITDKLFALGLKVHHKGTYQTCLKCGQLFYVRFCRTGRRKFCSWKCRSSYKVKEKSPNWKGGRVRNRQGYIRVNVGVNHPMAGKDGYVLEHRQAISEHLGRPLLKTEAVHHLNGIKDDNRLENLLLLSPADHNIQQRICGSCSLRKEIRLLQWQIKELRQALQLKLEERL